MVLVHNPILRRWISPRLYQARWLSGARNGVDAFTLRPRYGIYDNELLLRYGAYVFRKRGYDFWTFKLKSISSRSDIQQRFYTGSLESRAGICDGITVGRSKVPNCRVQTAFTEDWQVPGTAECITGVSWCQSLVVIISVAATTSACSTDRTNGLSWHLNVSTRSSIRNDFKNLNYLSVFNRFVGSGGFSRFIVGI